jgi:hypothetical protein
MSGVFDSPSRPGRSSIFDDDDDDSTTEADPFLSHSSKIMTAPIDSHPTPAMNVVSDNIAHLPSPSALQQDNPLSNNPPAYSSVSRAAPQTRPSYDSPHADPWSTTPRTNGAVPVAVPNFPRQNSSLPSISGAESASYLLDADHITIKKVDEKEGLLGFKHVNYTLASARKGTQVTRRYSDFAWSDHRPN